MKFALIVLILAITLPLPLKSYSSSFGTTLNVQTPFYIRSSLLLTPKQGVLPGQVGSIYFINGELLSEYQWRKMQYEGQYCEFGVSLVFSSTIAEINKNEISNFYEHQKIKIKKSTPLVITSMEPPPEEVSYNNHVRWVLNEDIINGRTQQGRSTLFLQCNLEAHLTQEERVFRIQHHLGNWITLL